MRLALAAIILACALPVAARAAIVIENAEIRPTSGAQGTTAAYMTIRNTGDRPDRLVGATCACAASTMAHRTITEGGVSRMEMEMAVPIPAHGIVVFDARGRHLMLTGVKTPIRPGARAPIVLKFEAAGAIHAVFAAEYTAGMTRYKRAP